MLLVVFLALFAACLGLWSAGAPVWLVFLAALCVWTAFALVLYPKVRSYKIAMGLVDELDAAESAGWRWFALRLKGLKVVMLGFLTSLVPFAGAAAQWLGGQNITFFFDPRNPKAQQTVMFVIGAVAFAAPFLTSWLHLGAIKDAAETEPKG